MRRRWVECGRGGVRREFLRLIGLGGGIGLIGVPGEITAQEPVDKPADPATAEAEARMALIDSRFGGHLDEQTREEVRRQVDDVIRRGRQLREFKLENGDAPCPVFQPYRAPLLD